VHGNERRTDQPIDVPDDRPADGGHRDIQVILIESATIIRKQLRIEFKHGVGHSMKIVIRNIRDTVIGRAWLDQSDNNNCR